jgi:hypothetical protein
MKKKKLILNFDLNKTLIMVDNVQSLGLLEMVNSIISGSVYGEVENLEKKKSWKIKDNNLDPSNEEIKEFKKKGYITYQNFVENIYLSFPKYEDSISLNERLENNLKIKQQQNTLKSEFTQEANPGYELREKAKEITNLLANRFIIDSFFELLISLTKQEVDFKILFRSFGEDFHEVCEEFNTFCEGNHERYKGVTFNGENNSKDLRINLDKNKACFYRNDKVIYLVKGTFKHVKSMEINNEEEMMKEMGESEGIEIINGYEKISKFLYEETNETFAIK